MRACVCMCLCALNRPVLSFIAKGSHAPDGSFSLFAFLVILVLLSPSLSLSEDSGGHMFDIAQPSPPLPIFYP